MNHDPMTIFNRQILNSICILVRQSEQGEVHGSWPAIADKILCELMGHEDHDEIVDRMQRHLIAVGLQHITEGSPVVFFRSMSGELNLVARELCHE